MKSTLVMLLATVALVAVLGTPTLDAIRGTNTGAGVSAAGEASDEKNASAQSRKDGKRASKTRKNDDDDD